YGIARGELVTSHHVTSQYIESLQNLVSKKIGKQVVFEHRVDPQVLGGARVKVNGWLFDDTLGSHLQKIKNLMMN
ncbi:MAG: F0F1 ATP synthase subunit delta, partial [Bdellovibrionaceae bacterium]|nr:F0F1 ATP synthase subunit delta [Pseudobdellovibrionaceae bacterium]